MTKLSRRPGASPANGQGRPPAIRTLIARRLANHDHRYPPRKGGHSQERDGWRQPSVLPRAPLRRDGPASPTITTHGGEPMIAHDDEISLMNDLVRGRLSRRTLLGRAAGLGLATPAIVSLMTAGEQVASAQTAPAGEISFGLEFSPPNIIPFGGVALAQSLGKEFMYDSLL